MPYVTTVSTPALDPEDAEYLVSRLEEAAYAAQRVTEEIDRMLELTLPHETAVALQRIRDEAEQQRVTLQGMYQWEAPAS
jgi:hypothetical protein